MNTLQPIRVLLVDDTDEIRSVLRRIVDREPDLEVVGEAAVGGEALEVVADLLPDAVVMDREMPGMDGVQATREIKRCWPWIQVIAFTASQQHDMTHAGAFVKLDKQDIRKMPNAIRGAVRSARSLARSRVSDATDSGARPCLTTLPSSSVRSPTYTLSNQRTYPPDWDVRLESNRSTVYLPRRGGLPADRLRAR